MATDDHEALQRLHDARAFVLDLDGTLALGDPDSSNLRPLPGALELVRALRAHGRSFVVLTNGTNKSTARYAAELRTAGFPVEPRDVLTPVESALAACQRRGQHRVMVLAAGSVAASLRRGGLDVVPATGRPASVDAVFVGWFHQVRFQHIEAACHAVWTGARLYSASQSVFFATAQGKTLGTSRAISGAIRDVTGRRVEVVGKPSALALGAAAEHLGVEARDLVVVGDDPELEVPMALRAGALAVGVHSGVASGADFAAQPSGSRPDLSFDSVADLLASWRPGPPPDERS